jgi:hypothetical protein
MLNRSYSICTTARPSMAGAEMGCGNNLFRSAIAQTYPESTSGRMDMRNRYYGKGIELLTREVVMRASHFRHLENFTIEGLRQAVVNPLIGSYPSHAGDCT